MSIDRDTVVDSVLLGGLPILVLLSSILIAADIANIISVLLISIIIYLLLTYGKWSVYGLSGLKILSWPSVIITVFTLTIAMPAVYVYYNNDDSIKIYYLISVLSFYVFFPIGLRTADKIKRIETDKVKAIFNSEMKYLSGDEKYYEILVVLLVSAVFIFINYLIRTPHLPIIELIKNPGESTMLSLYREESMKLLEVTVFEKYMFAWLRELIFPISVAASCYLYLTINKFNFKVLFYIFIIFGVINNSLVLTKSPVAAIFLAFIGVLYLRRNKISLKLLLVGIVVIFAFPLLVYMYISPENSQMRNVFHVMFMIFFRLFILPSDVLYQYFVIFPDIHEYLSGRSTKLFSWLHHEGYFNVPNYVAKIWWDEPNTTGSANAVFIGNFWADFGIIGVIVACFLIGLIVHLIYYSLLKASEYRKNILYVTFSAGLLPVLTFSFISSNFTTLLVTRGLLIIWALLVVVQKININRNMYISI